MNDGERFSARLGDVLDDERVWFEPDAAGADALLSAIRAEASPGEHRQRQRSRPGLRLLGVAAAVVLVLAVGAGVVALLAGSDGGDVHHEVEVAATELAPEVEGTVIAEPLAAGVAIELDVSGLPPAEPGTYYQGWVKSPEGELVTVGTFHFRDGAEPVRLWSGVDLDRYPTLTVTRQQEGAGQESSGEVVLTAQIGP